jgi:hypothetical protein
MTPTPPERNNPGYTSEYKELEEARTAARTAFDRAAEPHKPGDMVALSAYWLAAEVRLMRLERALER